MLTILDLLNHYLGFFNVNTKLKGRVYSLLAFVGDFYILYLAWAHLRNGAILRGVLILLAFLAILYFAVLNIIYYFTDKRVKWDISAWLEKYIGTQEDKKGNQGPQRAALYVPANGLYTQQEVLPAAVVSDANMQAEIGVVAEQLKNSGMVVENFGGLSEEEQLAYIEQHNQIYATHPGMPLPYFRLQEERGGLAVYGGVNEMLAKRLGRISRVGLMPVASAMQDYNLYIATAVLEGGLAHIRGRAGLAESTLPYQLRVELAYQKK